MTRGLVRAMYAITTSRTREGPPDRAGRPESAGGETDGPPLRVGVESCTVTPCRRRERTTDLIVRVALCVRERAGAGTVQPRVRATTKVVHDIRADPRRTLTTRENHK